MRFYVAPLLLALAPLAAAQKPAKPFSLEAAAYFPAYRSADFGKDVGVSGAVGYAFYGRGLLTAHAQLRGAFHMASFGGGGASSGPSPRDSDLTITSAFVNLRQSTLRNGFFSGLGLGIGRGAIQDGEDKTSFIVAGELGYSLRPDLYLVGRYETSSEDIFRAVTLGLGFRF